MRLGIGGIMGSKSAPSLLAVRWRGPSSAFSRLCWDKAVPSSSYSFGGQTLIREKSRLRLARAKVFWFVAEKRELEIWAIVDMGNTVFALNYNS